MQRFAFEDAIQKAVNEKVIAGAALAAVSKEGLNFSNAFGKESLEPNCGEMKMDTLLWIASFTKLLTTISVLQLVERKLVTLDKPLTEILPEYTPPIPVLIDSADSKGPPTISSTSTPLTLRHLLTHTSGMSYENPDDILGRWRASLPESSPQSLSHMPNPRTRNVVKEYLMPLLFAPGTPGKWKYGTSMDWAGKVVERVNPERLSLGAYMEMYIWRPLDIHSTTFRPLSDPKFASRIVSRVNRLSDGTLEHNPMRPNEPFDEAGGGGLFSTIQDFIKILKSLLLDDGVLLSPDSTAEMFRPQIPDHPLLRKTLGRNDDAKALIVYSTFKSVDEVEWNWGLGGLLAVNGAPQKAGKGTLCWSGMANCFWWIDRECGTAGCYGSQLVPSGDEASERLYAAFQKEIHDLVVN